MRAPADAENQPDVLELSWSCLGADVAATGAMVECADLALCFARRRASARLSYGPGTEVSPDRTMAAAQWWDGRVPASAAQQPPSGCIGARQPLSLKAK